MNAVQQTVSSSVGASGVVHLMITEGRVKVVVEEPERVMEEISKRATQIGPVLESIFREPRGQPRWGLNE